MRQADVAQEALGVVAQGVAQLVEVVRQLCSLTQHIAGGQMGVPHDLPGIGPGALALVLGLRRRLGQLALTLLASVSERILRILARLGPHPF